MNALNDELLSKMRTARDKFYGQTLTTFLKESPQKFCLRDPWTNQEATVV